MTALLAILLLVLGVNSAAYSFEDHYLIADKILTGYNSDLIPKLHTNISVNVIFSMDLYQIIEVPQQYLLLNSWIIERWNDSMLGWDPSLFNDTHEIMLPHSKIWIPDTTLYNSFFPFDVQECTLIFGSWTFDNTYIDYHALNETMGIGTSNCIENEGWNVLLTKVQRKEVKYDCCPNNYTLLIFNIHIQRKPLYYVINLILPTSIITLISIVGFFSSSSINEVRQEKITLGITTLLSMSILILMVSDKMPSTSSFIPLIGWFYTAMILLISVATIFASVVIYIQKRGIIGNAPPPRVMWWARRIGAIVRMELPLLMKQAYAQKEDKLRNRNRKQSLWQKVYRMSKGSIFTADQSQKVVNAFGHNGSTPNISSTKPKFANLVTAAMAKAGSEPAQPKKSTAFSIDDRDSETEVIEGTTPMIDEEETPDEVIRKYKPPKRLPHATSNGSIDGIFKISSPPTSLPVTPVAPVSATARRDLAQLEYDWLAAVFERICLIVFIVLFIGMSFGINGIGAYYWQSAFASRKIFR